MALLKNAFYATDDEIVSVTLHTTLGELRCNPRLFDLFDVVGCKRLRRKTFKPVSKPPRKKGRKGSHIIKKTLVLEALDKGRVSAYDIAVYIGADSDQVRKTLSRYVKEGLIVRTGHGIYALK